MSARDVVVVGGGPAGSATALWLARAGYDVELWERLEFPRAKACGDCVSPGANPLFQRLGVWQALLDSNCARLTGWTLSSRRAAFTSSFSATTDSRDMRFALAIARERLDAVLLQAARAAGVTVRTGAQLVDLRRDAAGAVTGVTGIAAGETLETAARLTIGADGLRSRVARRLGAYARPPRVRKVSFTAHLRGVPAVADRGELYVTNGTCLGIAPVESGPDPVCNVTVVTAASDRAGGGARDRMRSLLRRFPQRDLAERIGPTDAILASGPFDWPTHHIAFNGAALVGDAAGYYDPFTGQGIFQALAGAELLAEHAAAALGDRTVTARALMPYSNRQHALVRPARRVQRIVEFVCARPRVADRLFAALRDEPLCADRLVAVTGDLRPARDLLSPALLTRLVAAATLRAP